MDIIQTYQNQLIFLKSLFTLFTLKQNTYIRTYDINSNMMIVYGIRLEYKLLSHEETKSIIISYFLYNTIGLKFDV